MTTEPSASPMKPVDVPHSASTLATWRDIPLLERDERHTGRDLGERTSDDRGAVMAEYGLLIAMIALFVVTALLFLSGTLNVFFTDTTTEINNSVPYMLQSLPSR